MKIPMTKEVKGYQNVWFFKKMCEVLEQVDEAVGGKSSWLTGYMIRFIMLIGSKGDQGGGIDTSYLHHELGLEKSQTVQRIINVFSGGPLSEGKGRKGKGINFFFTQPHPDDKRKNNLFLTDEGRAFYDDLMVVVNAQSSMPNFAADLAATNRAEIKKIIEDEVAKRDTRVTSRIKNAKANIKAESSMSAKGRVGKVTVNTTNGDDTVEKVWKAMEVTPAMRRWAAKRIKASEAFDNWKQLNNDTSTSPLQMRNQMRNRPKSLLQRKNHKLKLNDVVAGKPKVGDLFVGEYKDLVMNSDEIEVFAKELHSELEQTRSEDDRKAKLAYIKDKMSFREWEKLSVELNKQDKALAKLNWLRREREKLRQKAEDQLKTEIGMAHSMYDASERMEFLNDAMANRNIKESQIKDMDAEIAYEVEKATPKSSQLNKASDGAPSGKMAIMGSSDDIEQLRQTIIDEIVPSLRQQIREELREELRQEVTAELVNKLTK